MICGIVHKACDSVSTFMLQMQSSSSDVFEGWPLVNLGPSSGLLETVDRLVILREDCFGALVVIFPLIMVVKFNLWFPDHLYKQVENLK